MEADNVLITCLTYNNAARESPQKYFVQQFAGVEELGPCTLDKCGQSMSILVTTAAVPIATSAATPVGPCCQSRSSGSWFQKPLYPRTAPSSKCGWVYDIPANVLPTTLTALPECGAVAHGAHEPLYKQIRRPATLPKAGASGDGCLYSVLVLPSSLPFRNAKAPRSSSQPYGGVALQDGTLLGPILHHDLSVPVGGTIGHPESTEDSVAHPPRDLLGEDICYSDRHQELRYWWMVDLEPS